MNTPESSNDQLSLTAESLRNQVFDLMTNGRLDKDALRAGFDILSRSANPSVLEIVNKYFNEFQSIVSDTGDQANKNIVAEHLLYGWLGIIDVLEGVRKPEKDLNTLVSSTMEDYFQDI